MRPDRAAVTARRRWLWPVLLVLLAFTIIGNLAMGAFDVGPAKVIGILLDHAGVDIGIEFSPQENAVVWSLRLPRLVLAGLVGAVLGATGTALQGLFRNPLADPQIIGISSGAALGAGVVLAIGPGVLGSFGGPLGGFVGALAVAAIVYLFARYEGRTEVVNLVLTGVAVSAVATAAIGYLSFAVDSSRLQTALFWFLGSFTLATWQAVRPVLLLGGACLLLLPFFARQLNLLLLGEAEARHLGVDVERVRAMVLVLVALGIGAGVATAGIIGFVGLLAPHGVRLIAGPDHRTVLPASTVAGAVLVLAADLAARTLASPTEIPVGLLTALAGGPFFLWLLRRTRAEYGAWG
ncbi:MAG: iron ABC transporter permease [Acidimicrobiia bacterium]|nr:iron ABC transporter permease [Acidimicrobiia bacterium]